MGHVGVGVGHVVGEDKPVAVVGVDHMLHAVADDAAAADVVALVHVAAWVHVVAAVDAGVQLHAVGWESMQTCQQAVSSECCVYCDRHSKFFRQEIFFLPNHLGVQESAVENIYIDIYIYRYILHNINIGEVEIVLVY